MTRDEAWKQYREVCDRMIAMCRRKKERDDADMAEFCELDRLNDEACAVLYPESDKEPKMEQT